MQKMIFKFIRLSKLIEDEVNQIKIFRSYFFRLYLDGLFIGSKVQQGTETVYSTWNLVVLVSSSALNGMFYSPIPYLFLSWFVIEKCD